jgi:two-component system chemotaxis sensor kinase CheA
VDATLLTIFSGEQSEHLASIRALLGDLERAEPGSRAAPIEALLRRLHTLKGAARAVGLEPTEMLAHQAE